MINEDFINNFDKSHIIIANDLVGEYNLLLNTKAKDSTLKVYGVSEIKGELEIASEFKIDNAREIIKEAYISSSVKKTIAIFAHSYNVLAQNALLKVLEEPLRHVKFILYINAKNKLIPTIFSRLMHFDKRTKKSIEPFALDIRRLNVPMVYDFITKLERENVSSERAREILHSLLHAIASNNIRLSQENLERFDLAIKSLYSKQSAHLSMLPILLSLVRS